MIITILSLGHDWSGQLGDERRQRVQWWVCTANWLWRAFSKPHRLWRCCSCLFTEIQCPWTIPQAIESKQVFFSGIAHERFSFLPSTFNRMLFICWKRNPLASVKCLISSALLTAPLLTFVLYFPHHSFSKKNKASWGFLEDFRWIVATAILIC